MGSDYETLGREPSGTPASFAAARAPESEVGAVSEPGPESRSDSPDQANHVPSGSDGSSVTSGSANSLDANASAEDKGSSLSPEPAV